MLIAIVTLVILGLLGLYVAYTYNSLVTLRTLNQEGISGIDVQLKQRANLIPNLVETVKGYMGHERGVLENVTALRTQALASSNIQDRANNENMLTSALKQLFAVSENYPDLKANQNFIDLQQSLSKMEDQIQSARRYYNGTTRDYNIMLQKFPSSIVANAFHFQPAQFFGIEDAAEREVPTVKF